MILRRDNMDIETEVEERKIYTTRYKAKKARETDPYYNGAEKIVKVDGGYALMTEEEYRVWKLQM